MFQPLEVNCTLKVSEDIFVRIVTLFIVFQVVALMAIVNQNVTLHVSLFFNLQTFHIVKTSSLMNKLPHFHPSEITVEEGRSRRIQINRHQQARPGVRSFSL